MSKLKLKLKGLSSFQIIIIGFAAVILLGTLVLMLPISSKDGTVTPIDDALFTATSAVCVTGLVVRDTATYWSDFGQVFIIILIQIGGLGVVTAAASVSMLSGKKISLMQRSTMQEAIAAQKVGGIVRLTKYILKATFIIEFAGAVVMMPVFCRDYGLHGIFMSFFHSISAFCNAGFDILGQNGAEFSSLTLYASNPVINIAVMLLIMIGGLGFLTWEDITEHKFKFKKYKMQSKVIITMTLVLVLFPALFYFFVDFSGLRIGDRILASIFQSVTARTAGFNTVDLSLMTQAGRTVMIVLMLIGGAPGSTAGGMKTTTVAVLFANAAATFKRRDDVHFFGRRIDGGAVKNAATILVMYVTLFLTGAIAISLIDGLPLGVCLFETASAIATVGVTVGITPALGVVSRLILIALMFFGRVGGLTLIYAAYSEPDGKFSKLPQEKITVG